jgi:uncharacterized cysteine cluster protein YcgN (CxxCxxCC family)
MTKRPPSTGARKRPGSAVRARLAARGIAPAAGRGSKVDRERVASEALPFWKRKTLRQMTTAEWESLCDGCGMCCVNKLEYEDTGDVVQTDTCCRLLDTETCKCSDYPNRKREVPDCIKLTPKVVETMDWLPKTCGYRLVLQKKDLYWWHPLVSGDPETVHQAGISARGRVISELDAGDLNDRIVKWKQ